MTEHPTTYPTSFPAQAKRLIDVVAAADAAVRAGIPADRWLAKHFKANRALGSKTRRLISDCVFAFFRWRGWIFANEDYEAALIRVRRHEPSLDHPLLDYIEHERAAEVPSPLASAGDPDKLAPDWLAGTLTGPGESDFFTRYVQSLQQRPPTWLRVAADEAGTTYARLEAAGFTITPWPGRLGTAACPQAISREQLRGPAGQPTIEIQDLASQCVGWLCAPTPRTRWWDMCAGSGGKSLLLAESVGTEGYVLATDTRSTALDEGKRRLSRHPQLKQRVEFTSFAPDQPASGGSAADWDGVLVDAPCSGTGTWSRSPDARWRTAPDAIPRAAETQARLLDIAAAAVRPGGRLVYSVCTATAHETTAQVQAFAKRHPDFVPMDMIHPLTGDTARGELWIHPWMGPCGGMFVAQWQRSA